MSTDTETTPKPSTEPPPTSPEASKPQSRRSMHPYQPIIDNAEFFMILSGAIHQSKLFPCTSKAQSQIYACHCIITGRSPFEVGVELSSRYHALDSGKLAVKAETMLRDFHNTGGRWEWLADGTDGETATLKVWRNGQSCTMSYTREEAKKAGLLGNPVWNKHFTPMLRSRCVSTVMRAFAPDVTCGFHTPDEVQTGGDEIGCGLYTTADAAVAMTAARAESDTPTATESVVPVEGVKPVQSPASPEPAKPAEQPVVDFAAPTITAEQVVSITQLKTRLAIQLEEWKQLLTKYNVTSAKELSRDDAERFIKTLTQRESASNQEAIKSEAVQWAEAAVASGN